MGLHNIFNQLLTEATPEQIYQKYYRNIKPEVFREIVAADPKSIVNGDEIRRIGKFTKLLLSMYLKRNLKLEDLPRATEYLKIVYERQVPLDITKIESLTDLYEYVKKYYVTDSPEIGSILNSLNSEQYTHIFSGNLWDVFVPKDETAACYLGVNTQWCTTWGEKSLNPSYKTRTSMFSRYHNQGPLYILISKADSDMKYQFHFESKQFMDRNDKSINIANFINENEEIKRLFFPSIYGDEVNDENTKSQLRKIFVLDQSEAWNLGQKLLKTQSQDNPLLSALLSEDDDALENLISDPENDPNMDFYWRKGLITFTFPNGINDELEEFSSTLMHYEYDEQNSAEILYDDYENDDLDAFRDDLLNFMNVYYQKHVDEMVMVGFSTERDFREFFEDRVLSEQSLIDSIIEARVYGERDMFEESVSEFIKLNITEYIDFYRDREITVSVYHFTMFVLSNGNKDINGNLLDFLVEYCKHNNVPVEYERLYDYQGYSVKYEDVERAYDNFFDSILGDESRENFQTCRQYYNDLKNIKEKVFGGQNSVTTEQFRFVFEDDINCSDGTVTASYVNYENGNRNHGRVKIENLADYATNYKLFEGVINIKRLIK